MLPPAVSLSLLSAILSALPLYLSALFSSPVALTLSSGFVCCIGPVADVARAVVTATVSVAVVFAEDDVVAVDAVVIVVVVEVWVVVEVVVMVVVVVMMVVAVVVVGVADVVVVVADVVVVVAIVVVVVGSPQ